MPKKQVEFRVISDMNYAYLTNEINELLNHNEENWELGGNFVVSNSGAFYQPMVRYEEIKC